MGRKLKAAVRKSRVLIVCAHEPTADPRISWAARSAAAAFEVIVLGLASDDGGHSDDYKIEGYEVVRLQRSSAGAVKYLWLLKDVAPGAASVGLATSIVLGSSFLIMAEAALALASKGMRYVGRSRSGSLPQFHQTNKTPAPKLVQFRVGRWLRRLRYVLAVMRYQYAPAADVFGAWIGSCGEKPDVIHCNDLDTLLVGIMAKKRFGSRIVYDAHEFYSESQPEAHWLEIKLLMALEQFLIRKADVVVTVNPLLAEVMRKAYDLPRVYSVPNAEWWIDPRDRPAIKAMMTTLAGERIKVLFQGRFASGRGIEELIEAWTRVDGTRAALFLRGPENIWRQAAIAFARKLNLLDKSVYFLEAVPEHMLVPAAMEADVGVIPYKPVITNDRFACPNKLSQYMHAGLMVVANDLPYVKSVIQDAGAGLSYDSSDPSSLAAIINRIVADRNLLRRYQESALRYAKESFNWQMHGETLNRVYREPLPAMVCNSPEPRGSRLIRRGT